MKPSFPQMVGTPPPYRYWARFGIFILMAATLVIASCQTRPIPSPTPPIPTPRTAPPPAPTPAPTPVPATPAVDASRPFVVELARAQASLNKDWDSFRRSYEQWRQKVSTEDDMFRSLSSFVSQFQVVKKEIADLPRASVVQSIATPLIEAAEKEESALIELRANWKPGQEDAFKKYEASWSAIDKLRRQADLSLSDKLAASEPQKVEAVAKYVESQQALNREWDALHKDFDNWRQVKEKEKTDDTHQKLLVSFRGILNRLYALTPPSLVLKPANLLIEAAEKEEAALRKLKSDWKPDDAASLDAYEKERLAVNRLRRESAQDLEAARAASLPENKALLQQFNTQYGKARQDWDSYRSSYNAWRNKGGDVDQEAVRRQLEERLASFQTLAQRAYGLPKQATIRPLSELLIQAAEKEEAALRRLRDSWKPYDSSYYQAYEKEWPAIDRLRRQAAAGLADLMQKYNISPADVGP